VSAYAHICPKCNHEVWRHGLLPKHEIGGPYRCECGCEIMQSDPTIPLTKREYERWKERHPALSSEPQREAD